MENLTATEAAERWGITPRRVRVFCKGGCIHQVNDFCCCRNSRMLNQMRIAGETDVSEPTIKTGTLYLNEPVLCISCCLKV